MTKITSVFPFLMTLAFLLYINQPLNSRRTLIFFVSMFFFDLTTTAINNYIDTKTNHQTLQFTRRTALVIIFILLGISVFSGIYLVYLTDIVVLLIGGFCFLCGIFYTYGPIPISRQPLGEIFSGFFYGFVIPFILMYINLPDGTFFSLRLGFETISIEINVVSIITLILFSVFPFCATANIMLANNICDKEKDVAVGRYTLPYYIGNKSLYLFAGIYYATYAAVIFMVLFRILHPLCLFYLLTAFTVQKNINKFFKEQDKSTTFLLSIKNYVIIMSAITVLIFLSYGVHNVF